MRTQLLLIGAVIWCSQLPGTAEAHMRDYLVNQSYYTAKKGEFEVEFYNDMNLTEADHDDSYNSKHQLELEYGLLDHLQLAYYEVYTWDRAQDWERDEFKIEAKLRLAEAGQWPMDIALYAEYANPNGRQDSHSDKIENKLILSRDFGPWNVVGNVIFERKLNEHDRWAYEYTLGTSYPLTPTTRVGFELKETLGKEDELGIHRDDHELYVVPGIYANVTPHVRVLFGPAFGLTRASDDLQFKSIVEVEF